MTGYDGGLIGPWQALPYARRWVAQATWRGTTPQTLFESAGWPDFRPLGFDLGPVLGCAPPLARRPVASPNFGVLAHAHRPRIRSRPPEEPGRHRSVRRAAEGLPSGAEARPPGDPLRDPRPGDRG